MSTTMTQTQTPNPTRPLLATRALRLAALVTIVGAIGGCNTLTRLSEVGEAPEISQITNPMARPNYRPVSLPMPAPRQAEQNPNSLWRAGARAFFKDHRAKEVGDIVTVKLELKDSASLKNTTDRQRDDSEDQDVNTMLGLEAEWNKMLPQAIANGGQLFNFASAHQTKGEGKIERNETINLTFAGVVTQVLPNGSLVITGRQEVRVNNELRELLVTGVIRPEDIDPENAISHDKIAEMRVAYGGRGTISDLQQPRWGTQVWDILYPF